MSVPQITVDLTPPSIGQSVEEFNAQAHIWTNNLSDGFKPQANALATFVNQKAVEVGDDATAAQTASTQAQTAATNAGNSASTASTKAGEASADAASALASKNAAAASQSAAAGSATAAGNSATNAGNSASTASTAATNAGNSASTASTAATNADNSASTASTKAGEASASASAALASKNAAATSESNALASKNAAATSETNAAGSASAAALSQAAAHQAKLDAEAAAAQAAGGGEPTILPGTTAQYWRGDKTWQTLDKSAVGLGNVDNTSDANKPVSNATATALAAKADLVEGKVPEGQLPAIAITDVFSVASQSAMLALAAERGDIAVRSDINKSFALSAEPASTLANWIELRTPTDAVLSVAGKTGAVTLSKSDVGLSNVDNTSDENKPVATTSVNGLMSAADKTKLNAVAAGATANATDAQLRDRSTHTGEQAISTVTGLQTALDTIPANSKASAYTLVLTDAGKSIDTTSNVTIPANSSVAFPVGTTIMVTNTSASDSTISITTDTLRQAGTTNTGSRTLAGYGIATLRKINSTTWFISGAGLS